MKEAQLNIIIIVGLLDYLNIMKKGIDTVTGVNIRDYDGG